MLLTCYATATYIIRAHEPQNTGRHWRRINQGFTIHQHTLYCASCLRRQRRQRPRMRARAGAYFVHAPGFALVVSHTIIVLSATLQYSGSASSQRPTNKSLLSRSLSRCRCAVPQHRCVEPRHSEFESHRCRAHIAHRHRHCWFLHPHSVVIFLVQCCFGFADPLHLR